MSDRPRPVEFQLFLTCLIRHNLLPAVDLSVASSSGRRAATHHSPQRPSRPSQHPLPIGAVHPRVNIDLARFTRQIFDFLINAGPSDDFARAFSVKIDQCIHQEESIEYTFSNCVIIVIVSNYCNIIPPLPESVMERAALPQQ